MLDDEYKKSAMEKVTTMSANELKKEFKEIGSEPETNEEWIKQCNTEQLVDAIFECTMANSWNFSKNGIKRWLKQPHEQKGD